MEFRPSRKLLIIWRIIATMIAVVPAFFLSLFWKPTSLVWVIGTAVWGLVYLYYFVFHLPRLHNRLVARILGDNLVVTCGVLYNNTHSMNRDNVQYTVVSRNPFDFIFGLVSLQVFVAGGSVMVPGIVKSEADTICSFLESK